MEVGDLKTQTGNFIFNISNRNDININTVQFGYIIDNDYNHKYCYYYYYFIWNMLSVNDQNKAFISPNFVAEICSRCDTVDDNIHNKMFMWMDSGVDVTD